MSKYQLPFLLTVLLSSFFTAHADENQKDILSLTPLTTESSIEEIRKELKNLGVLVLEFTMERNEFPTCDYMDHPEGCNGSSIINAEYVKGKLVVKRREKTVYDSGDYVAKESGVRVKLRGNTSSSEGVTKKSYKIKLTKKADLLDRHDAKLKDKDWILLGLGGKKLNYVAGTEVARACGMPWEPVGRHVAVVMNDHYMGCYYLVEAVGAGDHKVDIDKSGYLVENDAYWWKPDEEYFKTNHQLYELGWTFKEPDTDDFDEMSVENIKWTLNTVEQRLYNGKDAVDMIDYDSFARWMLAHDIMKTIDGYGSNIFVQKKDFDPYSPFSSKLEMGPLWDFDGSFEKNDDSHAVISILPGFWISKLWADPYFKDIYRELWLDVRERVKDQVLSASRDYVSANPNLYILRVIDKKLGLDSGMALTNPEDDYNGLKDWFEERMPQLDKLILGDLGEIEALPTVEEELDSENEGIERHYTLDGRAASKTDAGIKITVNKDGKGVKKMQINE